MNPNDFPEAEFENVYCVEYKGQKIIPQTYQDADGEWTVAINLIEWAGSADKVSRCWAKNTYPTKEEAIKACVEFGKQITDGTTTPRKG